MTCDYLSQIYAWMLLQTHCCYVRSNSLIFALKLFFFLLLFLIILSLLYVHILYDQKIFIYIRFKVLRFQYLTFLQFFFSKYFCRDTGLIIIKLKVFLKFF